MVLTAHTLHNIYRDRAERNQNLLLINIIKKTHN